MIKTKKTTLCVLLVAVLMFSTSMSVFAASPYETRYNNTVTASSSVSISDSGLLTIANQFQGIREKTTKGEITTYVEKRTLGFFWTRVDIGQPNNQWYDVVYDYMYIGSHSFQLNSHGTYRITVTYVISGTGGEPDILVIKNLLLAQLGKIGGCYEVREIIQHETILPLFLQAESCAVSSFILVYGNMLPREFDRVLAVRTGN